MKEWAGVDPDNGNPLWYMDEKDANDNLTGKRHKHLNTAQCQFADPLFRQIVR